MKIAIISPDDFTIVCFCGEIVRALQKHDDSQVYVISDIHKGHEVGYYAKIMKAWGIEHIYASYYRFLNPFKDLKYFFSLYRILKKEKMDMVINISTKPNVYGSVAAWFANVDKIVCSVWGMGLVFAERPGLKSKLLKLIVKLLYRLAGNVSQKIWFTNQIDYDFFLSQGLVPNDKAILTRFFVNTDEFSMASVDNDKIVVLREECGIQGQDQVVVLVARMSWAKGIREFIEAAEILRTELPNLKFLLVGPEDTGSSDGVPASYIRENEKFDNFKWLGFRSDVKELYALSDLAVYPSYYREGGYPKGLTEPMSMGKPIITTDSIHCRGTVDDGKNGYIVPIKDSGALAKAIREIVEDEAKMQEFGKNSRMKALDEFDEKKIVRELIQEII
jgi:N,N'-diacetylbacillosaminyl-diphospho-undecaprenol alpha-1,3-N-acetylgalactosaminyltransferase